MRRIDVLSVGRSDFGRYRPILRILHDAPDVELRVLPTGSHFSDRFGHTIDEVIESGFQWAPGLEMPIDEDSPATVGKAIGAGSAALADMFAEKRPDLLVVLGDRFEMLAGASAALGFNLPVFHIHGGAITEGAIDELVRHALTKMSHIHMVSCETYRQRVIQMGEEPWRVTNTGAPVLDEIKSLKPIPAVQLSATVGLDLTQPTVLVAWHPVTLERCDIGAQTDALLGALREAGHQVVLTYPNNDPGSSEIIQRFEAFVAQRGDTARLFKSAGMDMFVSLMAAVRCIAGNSSAGIVEATVLDLPAVNIGSRQDGKERADNIIETGYDQSEISDALRLAFTADFHTKAKKAQSPYGDGRAGSRICEVLRTASLDDRLLRKKFHDFPMVAA